MRYEENEITLRNGSNCIFRSPVPADAKDMIECLKMASEESYFMTRYPEEITVTVEDEVKYLEDSLKSDMEFSIAAFVHGELAGNASVKPLSANYKLAHRGGFGIAIKQKYWNLGIGNLLIQECLSQAVKAGYEQIELGVFADNDKALNLYKKYGFEVWGRTENAFRLKDGTYRDEICMGKSLN